MNRALIALSITALLSLSSCASSPSADHPDCMLRSERYQQEFAAFMKRHSFKVTRSSRGEKRILSVEVETPESWWETMRLVDRMAQRERKCCPHVKFNFMRQVTTLCDFWIDVEQEHESELDLYERLLKE